jgi:glucokinase
MSTLLPSGEPLEVSVGVDLGGTGTRIVALGHDGMVMHQATMPTAIGIPPAQAVSELADAIIAATAGFEIRGIGIGATGPVDTLGVIQNPETLPAFTNVQITSIISDRLGAPCVIDNDAVAAAIGEHTYGAGRGSAGLLVITLGTGVGVAALTRGCPVRGADGCHPEAEHIAVSGPAAPCYCGLPTCWEQLASRTAFNQLTGGEIHELAGKARHGEAAASRVFDTYGERVGAGLMTLLTIFRPVRVVIGGSAAQFFDLFERGLHRSLNRTARYTWKPALVTAELGNLSGAIGAAVMGCPNRQRQFPAITPGNTRPEIQRLRR